MTPARRARRPLSRLAAGAAAALLLLAACTGTDPGTDGGGTTPADDTADSAPAEEGPALAEVGTSAAQGLETDPAQDPAYAMYYEQELDWGACEGVTSTDMECATLTVPLVWNDPGAGDIEIAVARVAASGERIGSLVVNPGGPGGSGVNFLESASFVFSAEVRAAYDVVGFDPRGVNRSAGIECLSDEETDEYRAATAEPGSEEEAQLAEEWSIRIAEACEAHSGEVLPYLDTYSAARDMDVLRAALDSDALDYLGFSYGTYLGASYAELYPDRVGRFVLDGAMDPTLSMNEISAGQAEGFENAIGDFLSECLDNGSDCPFKGTEEEAQQQLLAFFASVDASPLEADSPDRPLTGSIARSAVMTLLYEDAMWPYGYDALAAAMSGDGSELLRLADLSAERQQDGSYRTNSAYAITAINCLDHPGVTDEAWLEQEAERLAEEYPVVGPSLGGQACAHWPVQPVREPAPISAEGAGPIVVIGTTGDPATPYAWAESLAGQLDDAVLVTYEGKGHTAYGRAGACIQAPVDAFLLEGTVPDDGLTCDR